MLSKHFPSEYLSLKLVPEGLKSFVVELLYFHFQEFAHHSFVLASFAGFEIRGGKLRLIRNCMHFKSRWERSPSGRNTEQTRMMDAQADTGSDVEVFMEIPHHIRARR
ncbi:hypothetical protein CIHG_00131 [Coccidioides immitis H538.4]|uniref:Uncharacterized protein n=3 Tax=Coccidioides immitis TaxID=5501 RepID=A0A0J8RAQ4_COCIT|nr:hypothetical protein CIRG_06953 [Coccidioides immitis RMSCC 2394]KMU80963.1 hypothetical protein CISG_08905 [Coccidioides immitis RMSCC 3703]KMU82347.1 hypothetical protein CIHG_00131 [Coccidioides immitis H538.4]